MFSLQVSQTDFSASIVNANLTLKGNGLGTGPPLTTADGLENWLESQELQPTASVLTSYAYRVADSLQQQSIDDPLRLSCHVFGGGGTFVGTGFDFRPVDGDAISFRVVLVQVAAVPEPSSILLVAMCIVGASLRRRR